jgi:hydrogenase expression/formation protein HypE
MQPGKLPAALLAELLARLPSDPRVLLGPAIGRDAAAIDLGAGRVLVAKTDPVTFATDQIGRYVVHVNANDIACLGARPSWFLATVLLPEAAAPALAEEIFEQIRVACAELDIVPIGGHTEITIGLNRPLIAGAMLGEATADTLVRPESARAGDHLILTRGIAIEGTALLAREAPDALRSAGVPEATIAAAARLLIEPGISVVREARAACRAARVHALHDPTEGGLSTALGELAQASSLQARVRRNEVPILPETAAICAALRLDPMGLLASGALLIAAAPEDCDIIREALLAEKSTSVCIGDLAAGRRGDIIESWSQQPLPRFERDELARFLAGQERAKK